LDEESFVQLYEAQLGRILNYVRYRLGAAEAEDIAAAILTRAWARRRTYRPARGSLESWLWAIARNIVTDRLRRHRPEPAALSPDLAAPSDPAVELDRREEWRQVQAALQGLPALDREIVALRFGAGHTNRAIAALLDMSEANVAQRLRRALHRMRTFLQGGEAE
jgi:RNA polymerase sigma-70 factor (ECF subfamily)